jgi:hypothetical protein
MTSNKSSLTIFANIRIDTKARLRHLKESFFSFSNISDDWIINVRGLHREETITFLKKELGSKGHFFNLLDEGRGWFANSLDMMGDAKYDYLFVWNEDHINIVDQRYLKGVVEEICKGKVDFMSYSWWPHYKEFAFALRERRYVELKKIYIFSLTRKKIENLRNRFLEIYPISQTGIFKKKFLLELMKKDSMNLPFPFGYYTLVFIDILKKMGVKLNSRKAFGIFNKVLGNRLPRYPKEMPFDLEKDIMRDDILPFRFAFPKRELFACMDDDNGILGYQLNKRCKRNDN